MILACLCCLAGANAVALMNPPQDRVLLSDAKIPIVFTNRKDLKTPKVNESITPAKDVPLGYPHGPKTSEFVPPKKRLYGYTVDLRVSSRSKTNLFIAASQDSFPCTPNAPDRLISIYGKPTTTNFDSIYDRASDRLITITGGSPEFVPAKGGYEVAIQGSAKIELKPKYVQDHLGYFLWDKSKPLWPHPVAGWCSWMAHLQQVSQKDIEDASKFMAKNLLDYGYDVIQIDDGYQRASQSGEPPLKPGEKFSELWTEPNDRFPDGLPHLAKEIKSLGLTPGIWVGLFLPLGIKHNEGYVLGKDGKPYRGPWVNYAINGLDKPALEEAYVETIRTLKSQGWDYFKIDTLRHVLYDNYRKAPEYWKSRNQSMEQAFREIMKDIKSVAKDSYVLACWGTLPELAGVPDGCRIGEDVAPDFASIRRSAKYIAQFHHLNNVVWLNDPDYMCLRLPVAEAQTWVTLTALAGGHIMISDPVKDYDAARVDLLRRVGPPMPLRPGNISPAKPDPEFLALNVAKDKQEWTIVARTAWADEDSTKKSVSEFGLDPTQSYLAFDFWDSKFLGVVKKEFAFKSLKQGHCQAVSFRQLQSHPQILGTDRHIGQGVVDLDQVAWTNNTLSGSSLLGKDRAWTTYIHVPSGWKVGSVTAPGSTHQLAGKVLSLTFAPKSGKAKWSIKFNRA